MRITFKCPECKTMHVLRLPYRLKNRTHQITVNCYICGKENLFVYAKRVKVKGEMIG